MTEPWKFLLEHPRHQSMLLFELTISLDKSLYIALLQFHDVRFVPLRQADLEVSSSFFASLALSLILEDLRTLRITSSAAFVLAVCSAFAFSIAVLSSCSTLARIASA